MTQQIASKFGFTRDHASVFADFIRLFRLRLTLPLPQAEIDSLLNRYSPEHQAHLEDIIKDTVLAIQDGLKGDGWIDIFGDVYMELAGRYKASAMGQFFTPPAVCNVIAKLMVPTFPTDGRTLFVHEPSAGSGRNVLAWHAEHIVPKLKAHEINNCDVHYNCIDLDRVCCDMTALNMAIHGMVGAVIHGDTLTLKTFGVWEINPSLLMMGGAPHIIEVPESHWHHYTLIDREELQHTPQPEPTPAAAPPPPVTPQHGQLALF